MNFSLLFHTLVHLRSRQLTYQVLYRLHKPKLQAMASPAAVADIQLTEWADKPIALTENGCFSFLNLQNEFQGWNDVRHGMLWAYNLNYMDWLCQPGMAVEEGSQWIERFIDDLPGNHVGLDPYPIALRGINWIKFISEHKEHIDKERLQRWNDSLYSQYVLLTKKLEYHLLGNHLLEDAYSLFIAAIHFGDNDFYRKATRLLRHELDEQILADGAHYEQSPMYHCILLDRLLDCCNFSFTNIRFSGQERFNDFLRGKAVLMLGHLESIAYPDGTIPLLNDSANGIAPTPPLLRAYARRLGLKWEKKPMRECGYRRLKADGMEAVVDIGNITATYQPGHSHADTFNYELRLDGQPIVVDTGISTYNKTARRQYERSTAAHNTVTVDGKDSSEVWGGFRVGRRAKVQVARDEDNCLEATHNGYGRPCRRKFEMTQEGLLIEDSIDADAVSHIHLWKDEEVLSASDSEVITTHCRIGIKNAIKTAIKDENISTEYNRFHPAKVVDISFKGQLTYSITKR